VSSVSATPVPGMATDRLAPDSLAFDVIFIDDLDGPAVVTPREPHRHDYHELIWNRRGVGRQRIDGRPHPIGPNTVTIVGRGQIHTFEWGLGMSGAIVRFGDELLNDRTITQGSTGWLLEMTNSPTIGVPVGEVPQLEDMLQLLGCERRRRADRFSFELRSQLLSSLLLWLQRWHGEAGTTAQAHAPDVRLRHRFLNLLEQDFRHHHEAVHYAELLGVPAPALARSLAQACGQTTKELVLERVMLEAARLLQFSGLTVGEVAHATGFDDPFYFSRAFKRRYGLAPLAYRASAIGAVDPRGEESPGI
jgi:AraC family transcriptional activator of pobA